MVTVPNGKAEPFRSSGGTAAKAETRQVWSVRAVISDHVLVKNLICYLAAISDDSGHARSHSRFGLLDHDVFWPEEIFSMVLLPKALGVFTIKNGESLRHAKFSEIFHSWDFTHCENNG